MIRASRASKVAGAFLVLFWHAKENLAQRKSALPPRHQREKHFKNHFWLSFGAQKRTLLRFLQKLRQLLLHLRQRISAVADGVLLVGSQLGIAAALRVGALVRLAHTALVGDEERVVAEAVVPGQPLEGDAARAFAPEGEVLAGGQDEADQIGRASCRERV